MKKIFVSGLKKGVQVTLSLSKVIFPVTLLVTLMQYTPILPFFIRIFTPVMSYIGLPGEASVPLVLGFSLNLYAGIAAIISFPFTVKEVFILAIMLSFAHNLFVESSVAVKVGIRWQVVIFIRLSLAILAALAVHLLVPLEETLATYSMSVSETEPITGFLPIVSHGLSTAFSSILSLAMIVIPLMVIMQVARDLGWLDFLSEMLTPFTRLMGIKNNAAMTLVAGLTIGLAFGAGVMVQAVKDDHVEKKDMYLSFIFLVSCHAVIEDTLIFIPLGIPVWPLLIIRLTTAIILTRLVSLGWTYFEQKKLELET